MATVRRTKSGTEYVCVTVHNVAMLFASELAFPTLGCALAVWAGAEAQATRQAAVRQKLGRTPQSTLLLLQDAIQSQPAFKGHLRAAAGALESDCARLMLGDFGTAGQQDEVTRDVRSHDPVVMKDGSLSLINLNPVRSFSSHFTQIHTSLPTCLPASPLPVHIEIFSLLSPSPLITQAHAKTLTDTLSRTLALSEQFTPDTVVFSGCDTGLVEATEDTPNTTLGDFVLEGCLIREILWVPLLAWLRTANAGEFAVPQDFELAMASLLHALRMCMASPASGSGKPWYVGYHLFCLTNFHPFFGDFGGGLNVFT